MIAVVLCLLLFARVWSATPASECELSEDAEAEAATVSHLQVNIGIAPEATRTVANSSMLGLDGENEVGSNFSDAKTEIENIFEDTDIEDNETIGLAQTGLGDVEHVHDDECAIWSKDNEKGHFTIVPGGNEFSQNLCFKSYFGGADGHDSCECSAYLRWKACGGCPVTNVVGTASVCNKGIRAIHCGSNARANICKTSTLTLPHDGATDWQTVGYGRRRGKIWEHTNCRTFDWGQDKDGLQGDYKFYYVDTKPLTGTRRRRGEGGEEHRRRRRRRGWR